MKVMTILGTRPEIIRLSCIMPKLDRYCQHIIVHTGQNYDVNLNDIFFQQLKLRQPDHNITAYNGSVGSRIAHIISSVETCIMRDNPDRILILGDTNSGLSALIAKRMGISIYHMEAGNRCYSDIVPEEVNRRVIDSCSDILMPYTERSRANLLREGISNHRIFVIGNPIYEVLQKYEPLSIQSDTLNQLNIKQGKYYLVTAHRGETVDNRVNLTNLIDGLNELSSDMPVVYSMHPHTKQRVTDYDIHVSDNIILHEPFGFFDFLELERNARCIITDSGTVQEECSILNIPCVTIRNVTERPETIECGSNILAGIMCNRIKEVMDIVLTADHQWDPPDGYTDPDVSDRVVKIVLGV